MNIVDQSMGHSQSTHKLPMAALFKRKRGGGDPTRNEGKNNNNFTLANNQSLSVLVPYQGGNGSNFMTHSMIGVSPLRNELSKTYLAGPDLKL